MNMTIPQPEREEWWESLLKKLMLTSPHSSYIEFIPALLTESRRRARAEMLEKVIGIVENMTPQPDYPTAHNGYQRFTDEEEKENEILNKILSRLSLLNPPGETKV